MDWFEVIPSSMSAVASVAAAIAAIASWRVSKQATSIAESTALATHHNSASLAYVEEAKKLNLICHDFDSVILEIVSTWPRQLQSFDNPERGGVNPRPLRHVLYNGSELLAYYASSNSKSMSSGGRGILSPIRNGMGAINETEYKQLLQKADERYCSFEAVFGMPSKSESITTAPAFRWIYYQLLQRVDSKDWQCVWTEAWLKDRYLFKYQSEYLKIKPSLIASRERLKDEKLKLMHTAFPITKNPELTEKYNQILSALNFLIEDCDVELIEGYKGWKYNEDLSLLVVCSMGITHFASKQLEIIQNASMS